MVAWTPGLDGQLRMLRGSGLTWEQVAEAMGLGRYTVLERGRRLGARKLPRPAPPAAEENPDRPPLPPGHPASWRLINAGTVLADEPYPYPVFL